MTPRVLGPLLIAVLMLGQPTAAPAREATSQPGTAAPFTAGSVSELISRAEAARQAAAELGAEWLETGGLIEQAKQEAELGHFERAADLAEMARRQGELAVEQAKRESEAWQRRVVR